MAEPDEKVEESKPEGDNKSTKEKKPLINRFSQFIVFFCMMYGLALTTVSYVYSALGYEPLVDLSSVIVQTIVAPCTVWLCQNAILNIFEKNKLAFSTPLTRLEQEDELNGLENALTDLSNELKQEGESNDGIFG